MKNNTLGKISAAVTGISVASFALAMLVSLASGIYTAHVSFLASMFIAIGYVVFATAMVACNKDKQALGTGLAGVAFAVVYALLIFIVYYAMLTTVRMNSALSDAALSIISYESLGSLFFNYNLLGYGFMGLSTFFIGFQVRGKSKHSKALRMLLWIHGVFFLSCLIMPMFPVFMPDMAGGELIGTVVLLFWCAYFLPVCVLGWKYFRAREANV